MIPWMTPSTVDSRGSLWLWSPPSGRSEDREPLSAERPSPIRRPTSPRVSFRFHIQSYDSTSLHRRGSPRWSHAHQHITEGVRRHRGGLSCSDSPSRLVYLRCEGERRRNQSRSASSRSPRTVRAADTSSPTRSSRYPSSSLTRASSVSSVTPPTGTPASIAASRTVAMASRTSGVVPLVRVAVRDREIRGTDDDEAEFGHREKLFNVLDGLPRLDHAADRDLPIDLVDVLVRFSAPDVRASDTGAARAGPAVVCVPGGLDGGMEGARRP